FRDGKGALHAFMKKLGRDMSDCGGRSSLRRMLEDKLVDESWMLVHLNQLDESDLTMLSRMPLNIVHCPRSHRYFAHAPFPYRKLHQLGMNISLGTDSLASSDSLNLFAEMRALRENEPWLSAQQILATVTTHPAHALQK